VSGQAGSVVQAATVGVGHEGLTLGIFMAFIGVTLVITTLANDGYSTITDFYAAGHRFSPPQNGLALAGDYMSAASFLGIAGLIALVGYDGFLYSIGFLVAWLVALMLVAELMRNSGRFTMGDMLAARMREPRVRAAAATATLTVSLFYLLAQMVGAGALMSLLLDLPGGSARAITVVAIGGLMIFCVAVGGMRGTTWVQIIKAVMLMAGTALVCVLVLNEFGWNFNSMLRTAADRSGVGDAFLHPGQRYGGSDVSRLDFVSLALALMLGTAGLPHILMRFYTVPSARAARRSVAWAISIIGCFYLMTIVLGFGAAALVGPDRIRDSDPAGNTAAPLLAEMVGGGPGSSGGAILLAVISAVAFATILAVVAGLTLASSSSFAHDIYANVIRREGVSEQEEVRVARISAAGIGGLAIVLSLFAQRFNVAFLVALAFAVAASANLPTILYTMFWRRFTSTGALWSIYGGLVASVLLVVFSPVVSGGPNSLLPDADFAWFPLENPGLVSIPVGFLMGVLGTLVGGRGAGHQHDYDHMELRSLTGVGAH
jgi:cation/acetate symporter